MRSLSNKINVYADELNYLLNYCAYTDPGGWAKKLRFVKIPVLQIFHWTWDFLWRGSGPPPPPIPLQKISSSMEMFGTLESWQIIVQWFDFFKKIIGPLSKISWGLRIPPHLKNVFRISSTVCLAWWTTSPIHTNTHMRANDEDSLIRTRNKSEGSFYAPCL